MRFSTFFHSLAAASWFLLLPLSSMAQHGPSLCKDESEALEACAETSIRSPEVSDVLNSCTDERSDLSECLGAATPDEPLHDGSTLPPSDGLLSCFFYLTFYDACVAVSNTTATATTSTCPLSCILDGPDQNCGDYDFTYCERQVCCTDCNAYMNEYDKCVANAGSCSLSNPKCLSAGFSLRNGAALTFMTAAVGAVLAML